MRNNRAKDTLVIGALAGIGAKIVHTLLGFISISFIPSYLNCTRIAAGLLLTPEQVMAGGLGPILLGLQIDFIVSIVVAIVTVLILEKWGYDYWLFKGAMIGLVTWALFYVVLSRLLSRVYPEGEVVLIQLSFLQHLVYGVSLTWSIVWLNQRFKCPSPN